MKTLTISVLVLAVTALDLPLTEAATINFEDVAMPNEQVYAGPGGGRYWSGLVPPADGTVDSSFVSGGARFLNGNSDCCGGVTFWRGFSYSNLSDSSTAGFTNSFSSIKGAGANGSANYAVAYASEFDPAPRVEFDAPMVFANASFTNTTYTALSMLEGDSFAKKFGGASGNDPDFLRLTIIGRDAANAVTGTVDFYLADYRFADNASDYVLSDWQSVALGSLGPVSALEFSMSSSDLGPFGANTPLYFALDNIQPVPLPAALWLLAPAVAGLGLRHRRAIRRSA